VSPKPKTTSTIAKMRFRMPGSQSIRSRRSTITNAFVNSLMPVIRPTAAQIEDALKVLGMNCDDACCVYCGKEAHGWDHLRPLVEGSRPTGYITEIANLVPCCGSCNSKKGNTTWRDWMKRREAFQSTTEEVETHQQRVRRLEAYEKRHTPNRVDFRSFVSTEELDRYWKMYEDVLTKLAECHLFASEIRHRADQAMGLSPKKVKKNASPNTRPAKP